jgi:hypothetical protein
MKQTALMRCSSDWLAGWLARQRAWSLSSNRRSGKVASKAVKVIATANNV